MPLRGLVALAGLAAGLAFAMPARAEDDAAVLAQFFAIWDNDAGVTPAAVHNLYADRVTYYGHSMSANAVYADKQAFIRRWPNRRYTVVPGTVDKRCSPANDRCRVSVTLAWRAASPARGAQAGGRSRVTLDMVRQGGAMKIVRESGHPADR